MLLNLVPFLVYTPIVITTSIVAQYVENNTINSSMNWIFSTIGILHCSMIMSWYIVLIILHYKNFLFFFQTSLFALITTIFHVIGMLVYMYCIFFRFIDIPEEPPSTFQNVISKVFKIKCILVASFAFLQLMSLVLFICTFVFQRRVIWSRIIEIEDCLTIRNEFKKCFETMTTIARKNFYTPKDFINYWMNKSEEEIVNSSPIKAKIIYELFSDNMDYDNDNRISKDEFIGFVKDHNIVEYDILWELLSNNVGYITEKQLQEVIYNLDFLRRRFCFMLYTDFIVNRWVIFYLSIVIYGLCIVFIANIIGYSSAFSAGMDMFKSYIFCMAFLAGQFNNNLKFLILMVKHRPFNIGDIMLIENEPYYVSSVDMNYTEFVGPTNMVVLNTSIITAPIRNLSIGFVTDFVVLHLPLNFVNCVDLAYDSLIEYAKEHHEIDDESIRCSWTGVDSNLTKTLICYWKYKVIINDRCRYLKLKGSVMNHLIDYFNKDMHIRGIELAAASGGAFNSKMKFWIENQNVF